MEREKGAEVVFAGANIDGAEGTLGVIATAAAATVVVGTTAAATGAD